MMKKNAIIISVGITAIIAAGLLWFNQRPYIPDHARREPMLFPPEEIWPPDVISAFTQFKELKGKWREKHEHTIVLFAMRYEHGRNIDADEDNFAPLTRKDILTLLGPPDFESNYRYSYQTARTGCSVSFLDIFFNKGKVCLIGPSVALTSNATKDELMVPPDENETEAIPAYPLQGVGSPDP